MRETVLFGGETSSTGCSTDAPTPERKTRHLQRLGGSAGTSSVTQRHQRPPLQWDLQKQVVKKSRFTCSQQAPSNSSAVC